MKIEIYKNEKIIKSKKVDLNPDRFKLNLDFDLNLDLNKNLNLNLNLN